MARSLRLAAHTIVLAFTTAIAACSGSTATLTSGGDGGDAGNGASSGGSGAGSGGGSGGSSGGGSGSSGVSSSNSSGGSGSSGNGGSSGSSSGAVTVDQACADLASSLCHKLETCAPLLISLVWGDEASCIAREQLACPALFNAPGTAITASNADACAPAYMAATCEDVVANKTPSACAFHGSIPNGGGCAVDAQCGNGAYCNLSGGQACGVCSPRASAGGACRDDGNCQSGLVCAKPNNSATGSCAEPGGQGAVCDSTHPCLATLGCTSAGTCGAVLGAGAPCATQACDLLHGFYCNASKICGQIQTAAPGNTCGNSTVCAASGRCVLATGSATGTCEATAADGQACDASRGPPCRPPAFCAAGTCTLPSANCR
jgi:hypothetical protein